MCGLAPDSRGGLTARDARRLAESCKFPLCCRSVASNSLASPLGAGAACHGRPGAAHAHGAPDIQDEEIRRDQGRAGRARTLESALLRGAGRAARARVGGGARPPGSHVGAARRRLDRTSGRRAAAWIARPGGAPPAARIASSTDVRARIASSDRRPAGSERARRPPAPEEEGGRAQGAVPGHRQGDLRDEGHHVRRVLDRVLLAHGRAVPPAARNSRARRGPRSGRFLRHRTATGALVPGAGDASANRRTATGALSFRTPERRREPERAISRTGTRRATLSTRCSRAT